VGVLYQYISDLNGTFKRQNIIHIYIVFTYINMAGKKRSGLANDRRAYGCGRIYTPYTPPPTTPVCPSITIADIATFDGSSWILNNNTTILACQTLTIGSGIFLIIPAGLTLTNNGTILNNGTITNNTGGTITNYSTSFVNNGVIYILDNSQFINSWDGGENSGPILTNNGDISIALGGILANGRSILNNNTGGGIFSRGLITSLEAVINNYNGGNITNNDRGVITNENSTINNAGGTITNNTNGTITNGVFPTSSTINNAGGAITNNNGGTITNSISCTIFNNTGGTITQNTGATFTNNGTISNADGSSTCGIGIINGTILGTINTQCPPP